MTKEIELLGYDLFMGVIHWMIQRCRHFGLALKNGQRGRHRDKTPGAML
jgi:hypothetical protein